MAVDEALLALPAGSPVVLRFYDWDPPGLSLGYFQNITEPPAQNAGRYGAIVTRRMTGGSAILHKGEITYSVAGDEGVVPFAGTVEESYDTIHLAIAEGLERINIGAELRKDRLSKGKEPEAAGRCFYRVTGFDLVAGGKKLVGSAQRRKRGRVLHHGSIPFDANPMTPHSACLRELAGDLLPADRSEAMERVLAAIKVGFRKRFGIDLVAWRPGPELEREAARIVREKYTSLEWISRNQTPFGGRQ
jgi:lipoyl(octanoyl) transferase